MSQIDLIVTPVPESPPGHPSSAPVLGADVAPARGTPRLVPDDDDSP